MVIILHCVCGFCVIGPASGACLTILSHGMVMIRRIKDVVTRIPPVLILSFCHGQVEIGAHLGISYCTCSGVICMELKSHRCCVINIALTGVADAVGVAGGFLSAVQSRQKPGCHLIHCIKTLENESINICINSTSFQEIKTHAEFPSKR